MEEDWWAWWKAINPPWRLQGNELQRGVRDWNSLRCPGQNGFLNVLMCLKWWQGAMSEPSDSWTRAMVDVEWVLKEMAEIGEETAENIKDVSLPTDSSPSNTLPLAPEPTRLIASSGEPGFNALADDPNHARTQPAAAANTEPIRGAAASQVHNPATPAPPIPVPLPPPDSPITPLDLDTSGV
ncbi:hypothetical protein R3P38DRAFT_3188605 [Favolaschia claudopus]|uniref:Uncharacterized protein n=1 Tax=Favolaschia claudopus TaxID=2862362 RepID=A0AAW0BTV6_9AGAR